MPEFMTSLPVTGVDGTMKRRPLEAGSGHVKTGFLTNVRAAAGYVTDDRGMRWTVVAMVNADPMPEKAQDFTQAVLNWCAAGGARRALQEQLVKIVGLFHWSLKSSRAGCRPRAGREGTSQRECK